MTYRTQHLDNPHMVKWVISLDSLLPSIGRFTKQTCLKGIASKPHRFEATKNETNPNFLPSLVSRLWSLVSGLNSNKRTHFKNRPVNYNL
jgi:hypothetical protein